MTLNLACKKWQHIFETLDPRLKKLLGDNN